MKRGTIELVHVTKSFRKYHARSLKETALRALQGQPLIERWRAINDVSLTIEPGERVGLLGHNGAGKSTLFRIISNILNVDAGEVRVAGRVSPLIEVTAGMELDMTGAENIHLVASLLGLSRKQIRERFDSIVGFAELDEFLETPTRYYSSGMQARLGFSIGTHVDADILLVDEALSVGDLAFQQKCLQRMQDLSNAGVTIVVVSHQEEQVLSFVSRTIRLEKGRVVSDSTPHEGPNVHHEP